MNEMPRIMTFEEFEAWAWPIMRPSYVSKFEAMTWEDTFKEGETYWYLVKGIIPEAEATLVYGAPQVGKSFIVEDMAMAVARGLDWRGHKVRRAGVVYVAAEGGKGFRRRQLAYARAHELSLESRVPIIVLAKRPDFFSSDTDLNLLIVEIEHWRKSFEPHPLGLIVIDTWSAVTPGAKENASEDVSRIKRRVMALINRFSCAVIVVHHKPKDGTTPRGHGSLTGDFETTIDIDWDGYERDDDGRGTMRDTEGRRVRRLRLTKQREGETDVSVSFVLRQVTLDVDEDGDKITSCVCEEPAGDGAAQPGGGGARPARLKAPSRIALQCLFDEINDKGEDPPGVLGLPYGVRVVRYAGWRTRMAARIIDPGDDPASASVRKKLERIIDGLVEKQLVGRDNPFVWPAKAIPDD